jgi:hypothetical protein
MLSLGVFTVSQLEFRACRGGVGSQGIGNREQGIDSRRSCDILFLSEKQLSVVSGQLSEKARVGQESVN